MPASNRTSKKIAARGFVALAGAGYWGRNVLRNLHELGVLSLICDADGKALAGLAEAYPYPTVEDFTEVLRRAEVRAVAIATPAASHYTLSKQALLAGKDVFVEKPLALTVEEGEELTRLAREKKRILMVGHVLHYHPALRRLKRLIAAGRLGKVQYVYSNRLNIGKLRAEEDILWSFAPHDISAILMLVGKPPVSVHAFGGDYLNPGVYDTTMTTIEFRGGARAHIFVSWLHPFKEQKLVVVGSEGMAVFDDVSQEKLHLYPHKIEWRDGRVPVAHKAPYQVVPVEEREPLREELKHFVDCVRTRATPATDGREGVEVLKVLARAQASLSGRGRGGARASDALIHETAVVDEDVTVGAGTRIWHFSHLLQGSRVGRGCVIGQNVMIGPRVVIGDGCKIQNNVSVYEGVTLEAEVFCGPSCVFTNVYNPRAFIERKDEFLPTRVKRGATIGANATIICGVTIGEYAFVGAGAVVKSDVPAYAIVAGVPARRIGWACRCGVRLKTASGSEVSCPSCSARYRLNKGGLIPAAS